MMNIYHNLDNTKKVQVENIVFNQLCTVEGEPVKVAVVKNL